MATAVSSRSSGIREPFAALSHLFGAGLGVVGLVALLVSAEGPWRIVSYSLYGACLILLYTMSAAYHSFWRATDLLKRLDHASIYLLIAGTYIPVCLISLRGPWGWALFGVEAGLALLGVTIALAWRSQPAWVRMVIYIVMGWLAIIAIAPLSRALPVPAVWLLVGGGVTYTIGAVIFALDRPHLWPGRFSAHDLWHIFVLGGSVCHFAAILLYTT
ncbi:MAG: hemolysin III family protein [Armatimonadetes bacterium]|nr:hemolysin III family protein [Armatimonadota bacterium]